MDQERYDELIVAVRHLREENDRLREQGWRADPTMPFGKYAGWLIRDVPDEYANWLLDEIKNSLTAGAYRSPSRKWEAVAVATELLRCRGEVRREVHVPAAKSAQAAKIAAWCDQDPRRWHLVNWLGWRLAWNLCKSHERRTKERLTPGSFRVGDVVDTPEHGRCVVVAVWDNGFDVTPIGG